jgi:adenylate kinase
MGYKVILLTGPPASGKSTLVAELIRHLEPLQCLDFGRLLLDFKKQLNPNITYETLRAESALLLKHDEIAATDNSLLQVVDRLRGRTNVLIDAHAVTREQFGFRVTASSESFLRKIKLDAIIVLRCPSEERIRRICSDPRGRLKLTETEADTHQSLQETVATVYGIICCCPIFIVSALGSPTCLANKAKEIFDLLEMQYAWRDGPKEKLSSLEGVNAELKDTGERDPKII